MQKINNKRQNLNTKIKAFNQAVLKAAQESIPRGAWKNYKPYWTEEQEDAEESQESSWRKSLRGKQHLPEGSICKTPKDTHLGGAQNLAWKDWAAQPWLRRQETLEPHGSS